MGNLRSLLTIFSEDQTSAMAPLEGYTLGDRHKHYNELLKKAVAKKPSVIPNINYEDDDLDNMMKIDIACKVRNVDYVLEVFKCDDMLYISRVMNKCKWLITDPQYSHIINSKYLHDEIFPHMKAKAITKLMLIIRRYLRDEARVKAFYRYVYETNQKSALQWLAHCSPTFIEQIIAERASEIPMKLLKRFCRQSISIFRIYLQKLKESKYDYTTFCNTFGDIKQFLINKDTTEEYLEMAYYCETFHLNLNSKFTHVVMKNCPKKVKDNFSKFCGHIDLSTFVKYIKSEEVKHYVLSVTNTWWSYETLAPFLEKLQPHEVSELLKDLHKIESVDSQHANEMNKSEFECLFYAIEGTSYNNMNSNVYRWYRFAPFCIAFNDIKKFILVESDPVNRHLMLNVLLTRARDDFNHLKVVLKYYHDRHINEPYLHKQIFINSLLSQHHAFRFDDETWNVLDALFHSSEVYIESRNEVQAALIHIIVHEVLRNKPVDKVVEEKFKVESLELLKKIRSQLDAQEQDKIFNYLQVLLLKRISAQIIDCEIGMREAIKLTRGVWTLINEWNKASEHHQFVSDKVVELGNINHYSSWNAERDNQERKNMTPQLSTRSLFTEIDSFMSDISRTPYGKDIYEKEMILFAGEYLLMKALKHNTDLLISEIGNTETFLWNYREVNIKYFLSKLRIYWPDTLASKCIENLYEILDKTYVHKGLVKTMLSLMSYDAAMEFIKRFVPDANKTDWNRTNRATLSLTKHTAKNMHLVRPQLPAEVVLEYAKGDNLHHALLSIRTMSFNLRSSEIRQYVSLMLDAPVSLQKHGLRLAFAKYKTKEKIEVASNLWKKTRNSSIRAIVFTSMFELLHKEKKTTKIKAIWSALGSFLDGLGYEENKSIYDTLERVGDVPTSVVGEFYQKSYFLLKKAGMNDVLERITKEAEKVLEYLDNYFIEISLLESISNALLNYSGSGNIYLHILAAYFLQSKDTEIQMQKYTNLLQPVMEQCVPRWANGEQYLLSGFQTLLECICAKIPHFVFDMNMAMPVEILSNIRDALRSAWCMSENYTLIRRWQLSVSYIEALREKKKEASGWAQIRTESAQVIASVCLDFMLEDQQTFFPSIYLIFKDTLQIFFKDFNVGRDYQLQVLNEMLNLKDCPAIYLLVIEMVPASNENDYWDNEIKMKLYSHQSEEVKMHYLRRFKHM